MARRQLIGLYLLVTLWLTACFGCLAFAASPSNSGTALPIVTTAPPAGYEYAVLQTLDTNTGTVVWIVYAKQVWWREYWKGIAGTATTAVISLLAFFFKSEIGALFTRKGDQ